MHREESQKHEQDLRVVLRKVNNWMQRYRVDIESFDNSLDIITDPIMIRFHWSFHCKPDIVKKRI